MRKKLNVATFRLSQVGGHTPKAARGLNGGSKKKRVRGKSIESDWRLDPTEEADRINLFGHLPRSSCRDYEKSSDEFPISLKRKYLNLRNQSIYSKMLLRGQQVGNVVMAIGRSSTIVKELEAKYCMGNFHRDGRVRLHKVSDDVRADETNVDSDCAYRSTDSDRMSLGGRSNSHKTENLESKSISPDNSLDGIFGPIVHVNRGIDPTQLASLFDAEFHRNCAVVAPHGMTLHNSSDEDIESASSTLSEMSINNNDDLCAFFDNINTGDSGVQPSKKKQISEMKTPNSDHTSDGDVSADDLDCDFATTCQNYEDDKDDSASADKVAISSTCLEITCMTEGEINEGSNSKENTNEERDEAVIEKEIINTQSPADELIQSRSSFAKVGSQLEIAEGTQNVPGKCEYEHIGALQSGHGQISIPSYNEVKSPVVTDFCLPTPPPSSDEGDDDFSDEGSLVQNEPAYDANPHLSLEEETVGVPIDDVPEEATSSKGVTFFQLQTQYSSSEGEEDDDDDSEESNDHAPAGVFSTTNNLFLPSDEVNNAATGVSSENVVVGLKGPSLLGQCLTDATKSKHSQSKAASSNILSGAEDLTDTPIKASFPFNSKANSDHDPRMSLDSLTDTPIHPRLRLGQQRMSLDSLTDTPCRPQQKVERQSLESLTDTPLERSKNVRQQRKRLRAAPDKHLCRKPEAGSTERVPEKERVRKRIEDKYRCRFLDAEAANDDSTESDEEEAIKQIEDEEMSQ